jgi:antitoxin CcdA
MIKYNGNKIESMTCDKCGTEYNYEDDMFECQEFHHINFVGGYGSVFGDGDQIECDICQDCLKKMIDGHYRWTEIF